MRCQREPAVQGIDAMTCAPGCRATSRKAASTVSFRRKSRAAVYLHTVSLASEMICPSVESGSVQISRIAAAPVWVPMVCALWLLW
eukprot:10919764-Heterocapsa_arctica.AAC.1